MTHPGNVAGQIEGIRQRIVTVLDELIARADEFELADPRKVAVDGEQSFDAEGRVQGQKYEELREGLQRAFAVGKRSFANTIQPGSDAEPSRKAKTDEVESSKQANQARRGDMSGSVPPPTPKKPKSRWRRFRAWLGLGGTGQKTGLDLLQVGAAISIPIAVVVMGAIFTRAQSESQQQAEEHRARDTALQSYLDQMSALLIDGDLRNSKPDDEVRILARARTLTILDTLDSRRKGSGMRFLKEAELIDQGKFHDRPDDYPIIKLYRADLTDADLTYGNLYRTDLFQANLSGADLSRASMLDASLIDANLSDADLFGANMDRTVLYLADLSGANLAGNDLTTSLLEGADLSGANLSGAKITDEQLDGVKSLAGATMPDGSKHD